MTEAQAKTQKTRIEVKVKGATVRIEKIGSASNTFSVVVCVPGGSPSPEHQLDEVRDVNHYLENYDFKHSADEPPKRHD